VFSVFSHFDASSFCETVDETSAGADMWRNNEQHNTAFIGCSAVALKRHTPPTYPRPSVNTCVTPERNFFFAISLSSSSQIIYRNHLPRPIFLIDLLYQFHYYGPNAFCPLTYFQLVCLFTACIFSACFHQCFANHDAHFQTSIGNTMKQTLPLGTQPTFSVSIIFQFGSVLFSLSDGVGEMSYSYSYFQLSLSFSLTF